MDSQQLAENVVKTMLEKDAFSQWLGIEIVEVKPERVAIQATVRAEMLNGFSVCHGGITFSLADSALAFVSNTHGKVTVSIENSMAYPLAVKEGDILTAVAEHESNSNRIGIYRVIVSNQDSEKVGIFRGVVYRAKKEYLDKR